MRRSRAALCFFYNPRAALSQFALAKARRIARQPFQTVSADFGGARQMRLKNILSGIFNRKKIRKIFPTAFGKIAGGGIFLQNMLANGNQKTSDITHIFAPA